MNGVGLQPYIRQIEQPLKQPTLGKSTKPALKKQKKKVINQENTDPNNDKHVMASTPMNDKKWTLQRIDMIKTPSGGSPLKLKFDATEGAIKAVAPPLSSLMVENTISPLLSRGSIKKDS